MKRILTVQDISCIGKCSLTVALPILSAMGVETCVLPTAVLSSHTSFQNFTFRDLTEDIVPISDSWKKEKITFDAIYTGYLGSKKQIDLVLDLIHTYKNEMSEDHMSEHKRTKKNVRIVVDPAMADWGKMYSGFEQDFAKDMIRLCKNADIILPNLTEACFLLGIPYIGETYTLAQIKQILRDLSKLGVKQIILTGVSFHENELGAMCYDAMKDEYFYYGNQKISNYYHGTGDIFASICVGAFMRGYGVEEAVKLAVDFTLECIKKTEQDENHRWYGVNFEEAIPELIHMLEGKNSLNDVYHLNRAFR